MVVMARVPVVSRMIRRHLMSSMRHLSIHGAVRRSLTLDIRIVTHVIRRHVVFGRGHLALHGATVFLVIHRVGLVPQIVMRVLVVFHAVPPVV
jgi:hypothetical protein